MHTGSCYCGAVRFEISGDLNPVQICHCNQCRKAQGGPFASNIPVSTEHFVIVAGEDQLSALESSTRSGKYRVFCQQCGSPIISRMDSVPDVVRVRAGTIDEPLDEPLDQPREQKIAHHQFVAFKASWYEISDDAPQYDEYPPK